MYKRPMYNLIRKRLEEQRKFMQVLIGPRQTGKTTLARQLMKEADHPCHYATADEPSLKDRIWIEQQWNTARLLFQKQTALKKGVLILDEIQKIPGWSETVKRLWDEDTAASLPLIVMILGSSALLIGQGLTESLAGRFETIYIPHWSYNEMKEAFGFSLDEFIVFGGYPGAADLIHDFPRWSAYINDSLIETTVSRDILLMNRVDKPALLRRLFELGCVYSGQVLSYHKMLGQLHDAGNTTTLAHYLKLLTSAGMLTGLSRYSGMKIRQRASSPKLQVLNTGLMSVQSGRSLEESKNDPECWGHLVESSVGASLINGLSGTSAEVFYWSDRNYEVDFILSRGKQIAAIEVKSGRRKTSLPGMEAFCKNYPVKHKLLVGQQSMPLKEFFSIPATQLLD